MFWDFVNLACFMSRLVDGRCFDIADSASARACTDAARGVVLPNARDRSRRRRPAIHPSVRLFSAGAPVEGLGRRGRSPAAASTMY
jgi:hypothetical protein